jgi:hypothetical protein
MTWHFDVCIFKVPELITHRNNNNNKIFTERDTIILHPVYYYQYDDALCLLGHNDLQSYI